MNSKDVTRRLALAALVALSLMSSGCGGGSSPPAPVVTPPAPPPPPPPTVTKADLIDASRFATRASFGLPYEALEPLVRQGKSAWLDEQFAKPISSHVDIVTDLIAQREEGDFVGFEQDQEFLFSFRRIAWWHRTVTAEDQLRQRVAFALSEIFVVSDNVDALIVYPYALSDYYDLLLEGAFGNFRDLLRGVTLHPAMGIYLSHLNNRRAIPALNIFPDENYAREVMQLFSIGLFELNIDGSLKLDADNNPIPTYDNDDVREFAKIFTGLSYGGPDAFFNNQQPNFRASMQMFDDVHEPGEKHLLNNLTVPAGQTGMDDIEAAIGNLFHHPNVGPFIGRQLIQRLVTSNPSPAYVERVARAFNGEVSGVRGDMKAVIRAVLLDPEAEAPVNASANFGKLREPVERYVSLLRQFNANSDDGFIANFGYFMQQVGRQHPLSAPSVFNFFLPNHAPAGEIAAADLVAPEFEITNSNTVVAFSNLIDFAVTGGFVTDAPEPFAQVSFDLSEYVGLAADPDALIDRLDVLLTYGTLSDATKTALRDALEPINDMDFRARTAIYLILISPDYAVRI